MASPGLALAEHFAGVTQAPLQQKIGYLITLAALIAVLGGLWMWSKAPDFRVLYANLSDRDGGAVVAALSQMNVPYRFSEVGGAIMVPGHQLHEVRMKLAAQDLPRAGGDGFRAIDNQKFGTSQFVEQINYQRALESELARSIQTLASVQSARVHLAINRPSVFVRDAQKPSASVVLQLGAGRSLEPGQVNAIVNLVSNSVPDLPSRNVTVVDQSGTLLSSQGMQGNGLDPGQIKYKREIESDFVKNIEKIISPFVGDGNVRAQVTAEMDFSKIERVDKKYDPNTNQENAALRSSSTSESIQGGTGSAGGGIPGAASNQPPQAASAPISAPGAQPNQTQSTQTANTQTGVTQRKDATVNYEVGEAISHTVQQVGIVKRLSMAVVMNHRSVTAEDGTVTAKPLTDEEKNQITALIKNVVGFNQERGDTLNLVNVPFTQNTPPQIEETPVWKSPELLTSAKEIGRNLLIAGIALYLVLGVLRPMLRSFANPPPSAQLANAQELPALDGPAQAAATYEANLQAAKQIARQDPKLVANVVRGWVTNDG